MKHLFSLSCVLLLGGCVLLQREVPKPPPPVTRPQPAALTVATDTEIGRWLAEVQTVAALTPEQAQAQLLEQGGRGKTPWQHYRYALLNQRLGDNAGWIRARDTLRDLQANETLDPTRRQLAGVLLEYSQAMINAAARRKQLATELAVAQREQKALATKIEALTNLEQNISERKARTDGAPTEE